MSVKVKSATLLTIEEAETLLTKEDRKYSCWWWLRSPGYTQNRAAYVSYDGLVYCYGLDVDLDGSCVRPALNISLESSNLKIGDIFEFGNTTFQIISENLAFCLKDIGESCFRKDWRAVDANDYETSDIKKFIDRWLEANFESVEGNTYE